jgi:hypothetical protein
LNVFLYRLAREALLTGGQEEMTRQVERAPALATLLDRHWEEIATAWAEMVHRLLDSHYPSSL